MTDARCCRCPKKEWHDRFHLMALAEAVVEEWCLVRRMPGSYGARLKLAVVVARQMLETGEVPTVPPMLNRQGPYRSDHQLARYEAWRQFVAKLGRAGR